MSVRDLYFSRCDVMRLSLRFWAVVVFVLCMLWTAGGTGPAQGAPVTSASPVASPPVSPSPAVSPSPTVSPSPSRTARRADTQTLRRDREPFIPWSGSFPLPGGTRMKIGGFVEVDGLFDDGVMASRGQFITSTIATGQANRGGADGVSVNSSRLFVETRTPLDGHRLLFYAAVDMFGAGLTVRPRLRLREAYVEVGNLLFGGDVRIGQAWATYADLEAFPNTLDFEGPNSFLGLREPLIRWSRSLDKEFNVMLAAETPSNHIIQGAPLSPALPDGVLALTWDRAPFQLKGAFVARDLRARVNGSVVSAFGWGANVTGKIFVSAKSKNFFTFSGTYGKGIGSALNDQPSDAIYVSSPGGNSLKPVPALGAFLSYEHNWSAHFTSTAVYGTLDVTNIGVGPLSAFARTRYISTNLVWSPDNHWLLGVEGLWGKRVDFSGAEGNVFRTQVTTRFSF